MSSAFQAFVPSRLGWNPKIGSFPSLLRVPGTFPHQRFVSFGYREYLPFSSSSSRFDRHFSPRFLTVRPIVVFDIPAEGKSQKDKQGEMFDLFSFFRCTRLRKRTPSVRADPRRALVKASLVDIDDVVIGRTLRHVATACTVLDILDYSRIP